VEWLGSFLIEAFSLRPQRFVLIQLSLQKGLGQCHLFADPFGCEQVVVAHLVVGVVKVLDLV
jgi:hypothetical protein